MSGTPAHDPILGDYFDALLAKAAPADAGEATGTATWRLCEMGRLRLLLPNAALGDPLDSAEVADAPADWHFARIHHAGRSWHVADLARCIAPELPRTPVETLLPVTGSGWLLAVAGRPHAVPLAADAIQWRPHRSSRAWLAGMSRDGQYMALDVHILIAQAAQTAQAGEDASP